MKSEKIKIENTQRKARQSQVSGPSSKTAPARTGKGKSSAMTQKEMAAEADPCLNQQACGGCLGQAQCGWCGLDLTEGVCLEGSRSGPSGPDGIKCDFDLLGEHGIDINGRLPEEQAAGGEAESGAPAVTTVPSTVANNAVSGELKNKTKAKAAKPAVPMWSYWIAARHPQVEGFPIADSGDVLDACREDASLVGGAFFLFVSVCLLIVAVAVLHFSLFLLLLV